jgi:4,5-DOPA dioxygenase extradiol
MTERPADLPRVVGHRDFRMAVPTPDHFLPLAYMAGLSAAADRPAEILVDGYAFGSLSMTAYGLDAAVTRHAPSGRGSAGLPDPSRIPPEETNT